MNPYSVPISVFRNREWLQPFQVNFKGEPVDISQDSLALVVLNGPTAVLSNTSPSVGSGSNSCTFVYSDTDMGTLNLNTPYAWQFLRKPYGYVNSEVVVAGSLTVSDSPPFP